MQVETNYTKEINWKKEWFTHRQHYPPGYWRIRENQRKFLLHFAEKMKIQKHSDWGKITVQQIEDNGGCFTFSNIV